jgi:hypothetical protein
MSFPKPIFTALLLAASWGCTFRPLDQTAVDAHTRRLIDEDLAKAPRVPPCESLVPPTNLLDMLPDTPTDAELTLRGAWNADPRSGACTLLYCETCGLWEFCGLRHKLSCRKAECCNGCGGFMALTTAEGTMTQLVHPDGTLFTWGGRDCSARSVTRAMAARVIVTGKLRPRTQHAGDHLGPRELVVSRVCSVGALP